MVSFSELQDNILTSPYQAFRINCQHIAHYLMFGSDGSGNPICLDPTNSDEVACLQHDDNFEPMHINDRIEQLGQCLVRYR